MELSFFDFENEESQDTEMAKNLFMKHYDFDFYLAKNLNNIVFLKKYLESFGIKFIPMQNGGKSHKDLLDIYKYKNKESELSKKLNMYNGDIHYDIEFPNIADIVEELDFLLVDFKEPHGNPPTLISEGYHDDHHLSPNGHEIFGKNISFHLKNKLKL